MTVTPGLLLAFMGASCRRGKLCLCSRIDRRTDGRLDSHMTNQTAFIAVVLTGSQTAAVRFPTMTALHDWEDANPEVEVVSTMPLVSRNYAEQVAR